MSISTAGAWGSSSMFTTPALSVTSTNAFATTASSQSNALNPFANLNLTPAQQAQIQSMISTASSSNLSFSQVQQQIDAVLTPTQLATLKTDIQGLKGHHHHHDAGSSTQAAGSDSDTDAFGVSTANTTASTMPTQLANPFSTIAATYSVQAQLQNLAAF